MDLRYSSVILGSGSIPFLMKQPTPPPADNGLWHQDGANVVITNPENFSLYRGSADPRQIDVAGTAIRLDVGLIYRRTLALSNMSTGTDIFIGFNDTVNITTGYPIHGGREISIDMTNLLGVWAITAGSTVRVAVMELA